MSAAAFAKGLLDLEGPLTPILVSNTNIWLELLWTVTLWLKSLSYLSVFLKVSLVSKDSSMLDGLDNASIEMEEAKVCLFICDFLLCHLKTFC